TWWSSARPHSRLAERSRTCTPGCGTWGSTGRPPTPAPSLTPTSSLRSSPQRWSRPERASTGCSPRRQRKPSPGWSTGATAPTSGAPRPENCSTPPSGAIAPAGSARRPSSPSSSVPSNGWCGPSSSSSPKTTPWPPRPPPTGRIADMAADSAIVNVEEWISEHYLTTDEAKQSYLAQVKNLVKGWKQDVADGAMSPLKRLTSERQALLASLSQLAPNEDGRIPAADEGERTRLRRALGYGTPADLVWTRGDATWTAQAWAGDGVVLLEAEPVDTVEDLRGAAALGSVTLDGKTNTSSIGKLVGELFVSDAPPAFVAVLAGRWFMLAERESWPLGRSLVIDLLLTLERNDTRAGGEVERVVAAASRESSELRPDGTVWWSEVLEDSRQHSVKVSESLREAVRESIELIANDVLTRRRRSGLSVEDVDGQLLARQSLRYLYRILFLLFAEASPELRILPVGSTEYDDGYGLTRLRDQILAPPATPREEQGTYLYESLALLFRLVDRGHHPAEDPAL